MTNYKELRLKELRERISLQIKSLKYQFSNITEQRLLTPDELKDIRELMDNTLTTTNLYFYISHNCLDEGNPDEM